LDGLWPHPLHMRPHHQLTRPLHAQPTHARERSLCKLRAQGSVQLVRASTLLAQAPQVLSQVTQRARHLLWHLLLCSSGPCRSQPWCLQQVWQQRWQQACLWALPQGCPGQQDRRVSLLLRVSLLVESQWQGPWVLRV
jgi:hypothetical protein